MLRASDWPVPEPAEPEEEVHPRNWSPGDVIEHNGYGRWVLVSREATQNRWYVRDLSGPVELGRLYDDSLIKNGWRRVSSAEQEPVCVEDCGGLTDREVYCRKRRPNNRPYSCTRAPGHKGDHVACYETGGTHGLARWPQEKPEEPAAETTPRVSEEMVRIVRAIKPLGNHCVCGSSECDECQEARREFFFSGRKTRSEQETPVEEEKPEPEECRREKGGLRACCNVWLTGNERIDPCLSCCAVIDRVEAERKAAEEAKGRCCGWRVRCPTHGGYRPPKELR